MMDIRTAARALGGEVVGRGKILCPGPGHSRYDRSLSVHVDNHAPDGFAVHSFAGDDWQACKDHVRQMLGVSGQTVQKLPAEPIMRLPGQTVHPVSDRREYALSLWQEGRKIGGTAAETYLAGRNIALYQEAYAGHALRFHPACPFRLESSETIRLPALVGLMRDIETNEATGIHRTALQPDGRGKASVRGLGNPKRMLGGARNAAVKLSPDENVHHGLHIAEGIETALAIIALGFRPMWACLSAGGIARFPVLGGIDALTIFADQDENETGQRAAAECGQRWHDADREARIIAPPIVGDFADMDREVAA